MRYLSLAGAFLLAASQPAMADALVLFYGTLIDRSPCVVNTGNPITVNFGEEVMTTRLDDADSNPYSQAFVVKLDCASNDVRLRINGTAAAFNSDLLAGNQTGFGFRFLHAGETAPVNTWISPATGAGSDLTFRVRPVRQHGVALSGGQFRTLASLVAEYL